eukprot:2886321-Rhodomonas_salina.1
MFHICCADQYELQETAFFGAKCAGQHCAVQSVLKWWFLVAKAAPKLRAFAYDFGAFRGFEF